MTSKHITKHMTVWVDGIEQQHSCRCRPVSRVIERRAGSSPTSIERDLVQQTGQCANAACCLRQGACDPRANHLPTSRQPASAWLRARLAAQRDDPLLLGEREGPRTPKSSSPAKPPAANTRWRTSQATNRCMLLRGFAPGQGYYQPQPRRRGRFGRRAGSSRMRNKAITSLRADIITRLAAQYPHEPRPR